MDMDGRMTTDDTGSISLRHFRVAKNKWPCWAVVVAASCLAAFGGDSGTEPPPTEPPANRAPEARGSIPDQVLTRGGIAATVDVAGNFTDPDGGH